MLRHSAALLIGAWTVSIGGCSEPAQAIDRTSPAETVTTEESAQSLGPFDQTCSYINKSQPEEDASEDVLCTMRYASTDTGTRYTFRFGGRTVVVDASGEVANGLWRATSIDGQPAVSLELWRGSFVAVTTDLSVSFEWRDRGEPKYPVS